MPLLIYKACKFDSTWSYALQGENSINCNWAEILWAALTVGKQNLYDVMQYKQYSLYEVIFRSTMIFASLKEDKENKRLISSEIYYSLDPSEKNAISYFQGLMTSKLLAEKLLNTTWLMHLDVYFNDFLIAMDSKTKSRPDFIGRNSTGCWIVVESKGRSNSFDKEAQKKAKEQTRKLKSINGSNPSLRVATQSYITSSGYFRSRIDDPFGYEESGENIFIDEDKFIRKYYKPLLSLYEQDNIYKKEKLINNVTYLLLKVNEIDIEIGIPKSIYNLLNKKEEINFIEIESIILAEILTDENDIDSTTFIGKDTILIRTGNKWNIENMILEPNERT